MGIMYESAVCTLRTIEILSNKIIFIPPTFNNGQIIPLSCKGRRSGRHITPAGPRFGVDLGAQEAAGFRLWRTRSLRNLRSPIGTLKRSATGPAGSQLTRTQARAARRQIGTLISFLPPKARSSPRRARPRCAPAPCTSGTPAPAAYRAGPPRLPGTGPYGRRPRRPAPAAPPRA